MKKIYWVSRHDLSPAQLQAIRDLHGDVEIVKDPVVFTQLMGLRDYIQGHADGFVYAVAGAHHCLSAALEGCEFGVFENYPAKRADGTFGLAAVYHVYVSRLDNADEGKWGYAGWLRRVWVNPDPASDHGESLIPVAK